MQRQFVPFDFLFTKIYPPLSGVVTWGHPRLSLTGQFVRFSTNNLLAPHLGVGVLGFMEFTSPSDGLVGLMA